MRVEIGQPVIYKGQKWKVFGIDSNKEFIAIERKSDIGYTVNLVNISELYRPKKKDELEVGDKFKINETIFEVLAVGEDDYYNCKSYFSKGISGNHKGKIFTMLPTDIHEVIYN